MRWRRRPIEAGPRDLGETLLELLVAIAILGVCVAAIGSGIVLSIQISIMHREQATAQDFLHNYAETLQSGYQKCTPAAPTPNYTSALPTPTGFKPPSQTVTYWTETQKTAPTAWGFVTTCPNTGAPNTVDSGLQQVTLTLASTDKMVSESIVVVLRSTT